MGMQGLVPLPGAPPGLVSDVDAALEKQVTSFLTEAEPLGIPEPLQALHSNQFYYKDPSGNIQGPFGSESLKNWNSQGYLYPELECCTEPSAINLFPFDKLNQLWVIQEKLGLKSSDIKRLADAEIRLQQQNQPPTPPPVPSVGPVSPVDVPQSRTTHATQVSRVPVQDVHEEQQVNAGIWRTQVANEQHAVHVPTAIVQSSSQKPQLDQSRVSYDPIDDIIDEAPASTQRKHFGERTLQPFTGMGANRQQPAVKDRASSEASAPAKSMAMPLKTSNVRSLPDAIDGLQISSAGVKLHPSAVVNANNASIGEPAAKIAQSKPAGSERIFPSQLFQQSPENAPTSKHPVPSARQEPLKQQQPPPPPRPTHQQQLGIFAERPLTWGTGPSVRPKFDQIQAEEMEKRKEADAAAHAAAKEQAVQAEADSARRAAWAAQPQQVSFRQILDDEECAADLEGGCYEGDKDTYGSHSVGYNPWQGQAALPADTNNVGSTTQHQGGVYWESSADSAPPPSTGAPYARAASHAISHDVSQAAARRALAPPSASGAISRAWQGHVAHEVEKPVASSSARAEPSAEPEPEILKNNPDFFEWCMYEMGRLGGDMNVLVVLLETGANCEIMDFARSNLKGDNIGAFVAEFIKRKANAAQSKPANRRRRKGTAANSTAQVQQSVQPQISAVPFAEDASGDGWASVATKGKQKRKGATTATQSGANTRFGGGTFAVLPSC